MNSSPLLTALRSGTQAAHEALEQVTLGGKIMDRSLSPTEYHRILAWQRGVHEALEPRLLGFTLGDYRYRPRSVPDGPGTPTELATAVGVAYVLEGSSLGGSIIYKKLQANPALAGEAPFTFYRDQADWGLSQWRSYVKAIKDHAFTEEEIQTAVKSAQDTFATFARYWEATAG